MTPKSTQREIENLRTDELQELDEMALEHVTGGADDDDRPATNNPLDGSDT